LTSRPDYAAAEHPVHNTLYARAWRLPEMRVDRAGENKVKREVDSFERIGDSHGQVVSVDHEGITDGDIAHEVDHLGRHD